MVSVLDTLMVFYLFNSFIACFEKECSDWRELALTIRDKVFADDEEQLIDIHDVKVSCTLNHFVNNTVMCGDE